MASADISVVPTALKKQDSFQIASKTLMESMLIEEQSVNFALENSALRKLWRPQANKS